MVLLSNLIFVISLPSPINFFANILFHFFSEEPMSKLSLVFGNIFSSNIASTLNRILSLLNLATIAFLSFSLTPINASWLSELSSIILAPIKAALLLFVIILQFSLIFVLSFAINNI